MAFPYAPIALAASLAGLGYSIFGGPDDEDFDIGSEMSKISALFEQARASARANINVEAAASRKTIVSNMAARGTLRSPVAEHAFGELERSRLSSIAATEGSLFGQEATARGGLLSDLLGLRFKGAELRARRHAAISGSLGSIGSSLMLAALMSGGGGAGGTGGVEEAGGKSGWSGRDGSNSI